MQKEEIIRRVLDKGIVAIIRADSSEQLMDATRALVAGGITAVEVTMTTPNAIEVIRQAAKAFGREAIIGVGTILDVKTAEEAVAAGAEFVITPVLKPEVIQFCNSADKPIFAGSYTPTEAQTAWELGADFIKIFPADGLGPNYIKALRAPLPHLKIVPTGGVDVNTAGDFIKAGCVGVAAGSSLLSKEILKTKNWDKLRETAKTFVQAVAKARVEK